MADKITEYLREVSLQNSASGTWGVGTVIARAGAKAAQSLMAISAKSAQDQFLVSENCEIALPKTLEALKRVGYGLKDPALFDVPTATFCVYMALQALGRMNAPGLVFVTLRAVSEKSTHVLAEGYAIEPFSNKCATHWVITVRNAISANFP
jgi:hypothetical protein